MVPHKLFVLFLPIVQVCISTTKAFVPVRYANDRQIQPKLSLSSRLQKMVLGPFSSSNKISASSAQRDNQAIQSTTDKSASQLAEALTQTGFPAKVIQDGAAHVVPASHDESSSDSDTTAVDAKKRSILDQPLSSFVESTLSLANADATCTLDETTLDQTMQQNFINSQVRSWQWHAKSQTLKIQHDPDLLKIETILRRLLDSGLVSSVEIVTDGALEHLYLPLEMVESENNLGRAMATESEHSSHRLHRHVALSGVFWFIGSILSLIPGLRWLKYFGVLSVLFGLPPVTLKALRTARRREFDANCMMVIAAIGALALGELDEAASVSFLFSVSEYLESRATERARKALEAIVNLRPDRANMIHPETKEMVIVPAEMVPVGSLISVRTGDKVVADGIVVEGTSSVDESSLTGEATPVFKTINSTVSGGTINIGTTQLVVRTTSTVEDSAVSRLVRLSEDATANVSPTEKMIDGFARAYTPSVVTVAALMATVPWAFGHKAGRYWMLNALIIIVIACPCALTISTPVTYAAGLAATAQRGIVVKGGANLESLGSVDKIVLDKTGTLTEGKFSVSNLEVIGNSRSRKEVLSLLAMMEAPCSHPLSATLVNAARSEGVSIAPDVEVKEHKILKGEGVEATVGGKQTYVGNRRLFERLGMFDGLSQSNKDLTTEWSSKGGTVGFLGVENEGIIGAFCMTDSIRPEAKDTVESLLQGGFDVYLLTGDGDGAARAVAEQVGIPQSAVHSQLLPEDKLHFVGSLKRPPLKSSLSLFHQKGKVLFLGDGVNDSPAIALSDVGVSMGEGAAVAMETSDVTLMDSNLEKLLYVIKMGTRVLHTVRENIILTLVCKIVVVALTFAGFMTLLFAIASDVGVMLLVTLNGMKLLPGDTESPLRKLLQRVRLQR